MQIIPLTNGYTFHTEVTEIVTVDAVGFLKFETRETKRVGHVRNHQGVYEHGMCMPSMDLSMDEATAVAQVSERLDGLIRYYRESDEEYKRMMKKLGKA